MTKPAAAAPAAFVPDPTSCFLGIIDIPRADFSALPAHPAQRYTPLHAAVLMNAKVLEHALDQHRDVACVLVADAATGATVEALRAIFDNDPIAAVKRYGIKSDGHSRDYLWTRNLAPVPETLRLTVRAAANRDAATRVYTATDSLQAVKGHKDNMQSTLRMADIEPQSDYVKAAASLGSALQLAGGVLCGAISQKHRPFLNKVLSQPDEAELEEMLPMLPLTRVFKPAVQIIDELDLTSAPVPLEAAFVAGYLTILHRSPEEGHRFLEQLKQPDSGTVGDGKMDPFYAVKQVRAYLFERQRFIKSTPAIRNQSIILVVLNAFEAWLNQQSFEAGKFPFKPDSIRRFNPQYRRAVNNAENEAAIQAKERKQARRRATATRPDATVEAMLNL